MANNYTDFVKNIPIPWLTSNTNGLKYWAQIANLMDANTESTKDGVMASFPEYCPTDGYSYLGREYGILQGVSETDTAFSYRMRRYWNAWEFSGTALGILAQLYFQGYTNAYLIQRNGLVFQLNGRPDISNTGDMTDVLTYWDAGNNPVTGQPIFTFNDEYNIASRFTIYLPVPAAWTDIQDPPTNTSSPTISELNIILESINQWKPAKATFDGLIVSNYWTIGFPKRTISCAPGSPNAINYKAGVKYVFGPDLY